MCYPPFFLLSWFCLQVSYLLLVLIFDFLFCCCVVCFEKNRALACSLGTGSSQDTSNRLTTLWLTIWRWNLLFMKRDTKRLSPPRGARRVHIRWLSTDLEKTLGQVERKLISTGAGWFCFVFLMKGKIFVTPPPGCT